MPRVRRTMPDSSTQDSTQQRVVNVRRGYNGNVQAAGTSPRRIPRLIATLYTRGARLSFNWRPSRSRRGHGTTVSRARTLNPGTFDTPLSRRADSISHSLQNATRRQFQCITVGTNFSRPWRYSNEREEVSSSKGRWGGDLETRSSVNFPDR